MTHKHSIECEQHVSNKQAGGKSTKLDTPLRGTSTVAMGPDRAQVSHNNHMQANTKVIMALRAFETTELSQTTIMCQCNLGETKLCKGWKQKSMAVVKKVAETPGSDRRDLFHHYGQRIAPTSDIMHDTYHRLGFGSVRYFRAQRTLVVSADVW